MILDMHGEPLGGGIEGRPLGHGPGEEYAVVLQAHVVVKVAGQVFLHAEETRLAAAGRRRCTAGTAASFAGAMMCTPATPGMAANASIKSVQIREPSATGSAARSSRSMNSLGTPVLWLSLMSSAATLPFFLFTLPAGALADRADRRQLLRISSAWLAISAGLLACCAFLGGLTSQSSLRASFCWAPVLRLASARR
jgi:MFS family permease